MVVCSCMNELCVLSCVCVVFESMSNLGTFTILPSLLEQVFLEDFAVEWIK